MSNLICFVLIFAVFISTIEAIACYNHFERCTPTPLCINETTKRNCTDPQQKYCYKDVYLLSLAVRGCAEMAFCNASLFLGNRYCCDTDYCNHAMGKPAFSWLMILIIMIIFR